MKVSAKIDLPAEITKDSVVKELLAQKQALEGKIGRLERKIVRLENEIELLESTAKIYLDMEEYE